MNRAAQLLIDGHVHYYPEYEFDHFFSQALKNAALGERVLPAEGLHRIPVLMLTEAKTFDYFSRWRDEADRFVSKGGFRFQWTDEETALSLHRGQEGRPLCYLIRGRQVVTQENLEVLALATSQTIPDGRPTEEVIHQLVDNQEMAVLAWGVGKWLLKRERVVSRVIEQIVSPYLFLGDNSARPLFWSTPRTYLQARQAGVRIINGSDPLPFKSEASRVMGYGFGVQGSFDEKRPAQSIIRLLTDHEGGVKTVFFGHRDGFFSFLARQIKINGRKHLHRS